MDDGRITKKAVYGVHIPLYCTRHPDLRWNTKNISHIGARKIFYISGGNECSCNVGFLRVLEDPTAPDVE